MGVLSFSQMDSFEEESRITFPWISSLWEGRLSRVAKKDGDEKGETCLWIPAQIHKQEAVAGEGVKNKRGISEGGMRTC